MKIMSRFRLRLSIAMIAPILALFFTGCGPVKKPANAYIDGNSLINDMISRRSRIRSFRLAGKVDHFGEKHRIQGRLFVFAMLPDNLRVELLSPFGSTLSILAVKNGFFSMSDYREDRHYKGPAEPCNIAKLIRVYLTPKEVISALVGSTPLIEGGTSVEWNRLGFYEVAIRDETRIQTLQIGPDHEVLPLMRSTLTDEKGIVFDMSFEKWRPVGDYSVPFEIRVKMPREEADLLIRYDDDGFEPNTDLPPDAFEHTFSPGTNVQKVDCE